MATQPNIAGLRRLGAPDTSNWSYSTTRAAVELQPDTPEYSCVGGNPPALFPPISCPNPGPDSWSDSVTFPEDFGAPFYVPAPAALDPQPDLALVFVQLGLSFEPYTVGCKNPMLSPPNDGFGCVVPARGYDEAEVAITATIAGSTVDFHPAGLVFSPSFAPARDPGYFDGFDESSEIGPQWSQGGEALLKPPDPLYSDPLPTDPGLPYSPYLLAWDDVIGATFALSASSPDQWHRITSGGLAPFAITIVPYFYNVRPTRSAAGLMAVL